MGSVHTELLPKALALAMQKWVEKFAKKWAEHPFLAMPANANSIANSQCERTLNASDNACISADADARCEWYFSNQCRSSKRQRMRQH